MKPIRTVVSLVLTTVLLATAAWAAEGPPAPPHASRGGVLDHRYDHHRYYPPRGSVVGSLPPGHYVTHWRGSPYYFHSGVWYRPEHSHWVVITPPVGLVVPFLPAFYTTLWIGGIPYYYANDVYYAWRPAARSYVVVEAPPEKAAVEPAAPDKLYVYPRDGQSAQQLETDRYECHRWAADESGFDPTRPLGGVPAEQVSEKRAAYFRATTACLEGRGYSVK